MAPRTTNPGRRVLLNLIDPQWDAVVAYARAAFPDQPLAFGVREMLLIASGVDPLDAAVQAARHAAYSAMLNRLRVKALTAIGSLHDALLAEEAQAAIARDPFGGTGT